MFYTFAGMTSLTTDSELYNFIASWELTKTPQHFVQGSFSIKSLKLKLWHKNRGEFLASGPFKTCPTVSQRIRFNKTITR